MSFRRPFDVFFGEGLGELSESEVGCCGFFEFDLRRDGDELRWTATAPPDRRRAIALLDDLAIASLPAATHAA